MITHPRLYKRDSMGRTRVWWALEPKQLNVPPRTTKS
jgi:hypothetical protein